MEENDISRVVVDSAIEVHRTLGGPGLLEAVYEEALVHEIRLRNLTVERQVSVPLLYKGSSLATPLRLDLLIGQKVVVECKAVTTYNPIFQSQVLTYLRLTGLKLGLVINFGEALVAKGIYRVANGL